jgi:pyruvate-ferredoxin/flavodoxin oxidoreductase
MLSSARKGGTFLLTTFHGPGEVWDTLPQEVQKRIVEKKLKFYVIDAISLAQEIGLGARINVIMQTAFFKISNIIPLDQAVQAIKDAIRKTYGKRGEKVIQMNYAAVDKAIDASTRSRCPARSPARSRCRRSYRPMLPSSCRR